MQRPAAAAMTRRPIEQQTNVIVLFAFQPGGGSSSDKWVLGATASSGTESLDSWREGSTESHWLVVPHVNKTSAGPTQLNLS